MGAGNSSSEIEGLGIWSAVRVAPSACLTSVHSFSQLVDEMLPSPFTSTPVSYVDEAKLLWSVENDCQPPEENAAHKEKSWDSPRTTSAAQHLLDDATSAWP